VGDMPRRRFPWVRWLVGHTLGFGIGLLILSSFRDRLEPTSWAILGVAGVIAIYSIVTINVLLARRRTHPR
jgi:hypothetical protein